MKMIAVLIFTIIVFSSLVIAESTIHGLTKGQADTLYCQKFGLCELSELIVDNLTVTNTVNLTVTNYNVTGNANIDGNISANFYCHNNFNLCYNLTDINNSLSNIVGDTNASTACALGEYLDGDGLCKGVNSSIDARTASVTYLPWNVTVPNGAGEVIGGNVSCINVSGVCSLNVSEDNGAPPVLDIYINFTDVEDFNTIIFNVWYEGSSGHEIEVGLYSYTENQYEEEYEDITDMDGFEYMLINVLDPENHIDPDGNVSLRFRHENNGISSHIFHLDYISLVDGFTTITTSRHDALGDRDDINNHPWAFDIEGSRTVEKLNVTGNITMDTKLSMGAIDLEYSAFSSLFSINAPFFGVGDGINNARVMFNGGGYLEWNEVANDFNMNYPLTVDGTLTADNLNIDNINLNGNTITTIGAMNLVSSGSLVNFMSNEVLGIDTLEADGETTINDNLISESLEIIPISATETQWSTLTLPQNRLTGSITSDTATPSIEMRRRKIGPTDLSDNNNMFALRGRGYDLGTGDWSSPLVQMIYRADGDHSSGSLPSKIIFGTTSKGDTGVTFGMTLDRNQSLFLPMVYGDDLTGDTSLRALQINDSGMLGYISSSITHKENVRNLSSDDSDWIYDLKPKIYDRKDGSRDDEIGLIAEEVVLINPTLVTYKRNVTKIEVCEFDKEYNLTDCYYETKFTRTNQVETVEYTRNDLIVSMLAEIQRLNDRVTDLEK